VQPFIAVGSSEPETHFAYKRKGSIPFLDNRLISKLVLERARVAEIKEKQPVAKTPDPVVS